MLWEINTLKEALDDAIRCATVNGGEWYVSKDYEKGCYYRGAVGRPFRGIRFIAVRLTSSSEGFALEKRRLI